MKRALILFGAGASVEYKAPSTLVLTDNNEIKVLADPSPGPGAHRRAAAISTASGKILTLDVP